MNKIKILVRKEIMDILRDRKTLIMMVVVPVLLYPLIIIGMALIFGRIAQSQEEKVYTVGYSAECEDTVSRLRELYQKEKENDDGEGGLVFVAWQGDRPLQKEAEEMAGNADQPQENDASQKESGELAGDVGQLSFEMFSGEDTPDILLNITEENGAEHIAVVYNSTDQDSEAAMYEAEELLELYCEELLDDRLAEKGLTEDFLHPVTFEAEDQASDSESFGMNIGGSIGMVLVVTILLGVIYPAIDATAGEKERGTLETLLTLPVTNFQMILSKYISVSLFACITAIISLLSLGGSVLFLIFGVAGEILKDMPYIPAVVLAAAVPGLLLTMISTALLVTAVCMCFCVFARSFKEANNYVTPVLLIIMFASMAGMLPIVEFDHVTAMIPFVNVSLMIRQVTAWQFDPSLAGITILVNLGCSLLIVWVLARIYNSENVLFSDGFAGFALFRKRSEIKKGTIPAPGDLLVGITALLLLLLYAGSAASVRFGFWGAMVSQLLIFAVPLFMVWYLKSDVRTLFSLHRPRCGTVMGSILLYLGVYCLMICAGSLFMELLPGSTENLETSFGPVLDQPFPVILLVTAAMPAVGEEILFRGLLFGSLRARVSVTKAILISAAVFAVFHMSLVKLVPTFMLGAVFAFILSESGSLYVTSFLHFLNNAVSMMVSKYPEQAGKILPFLVKEKLEAPELLILLAAGSGLALAGAALLHRNARRVL